MATRDRQSDPFFTLKPASGELLNLDLMRFIASVGIVLCHSLEFFVAPQNRPEIRLRGGGLSLFVDVFFVISGFVIAYVYASRMDSGWSYLRFLQRRIGRLYPLHLLTLIVATVLFAVIARAGIHMTHSQGLTTRCVVQAAVLIHAFAGCGSGVPNGVSWSISAEMLMYVLFPAFLWLGKRSRWALLAGAAIALVAFALQPGAASGWGGLDMGLRAVPGFMFGVALFGFRDVLARASRAGYVALLAAGLLYLGSMLSWPALLLVGIAYFAAAAAVAADCAGATNRWVTKLAPLGQLTYSLYMVHGLFIVVLPNGLGDKALHLSQPALGALTLATYALILAVAFLSFKLFETPARRWIDGLGARPGLKDQPETRVTQTGSE